MSTTIVLFEDAEPFTDLNFPITFRALIDYSGIDRWSVEAFDAQGAQGGWVQIPRDHALWPVFDAYLRSPAGFDTVEGQIAGETEHDVYWPAPAGSYSHAAE